MFTLVIDYREHALIELLTAAKTEYTTKNLALGDVCIRDDGAEYIVLERKTLADLASSITDGRYEEQSLRLCTAAVHKHNIMYLIEGDMAKFRGDRERLYSAMVSLGHYKGFSVMRTQSVAETATVIRNLVAKLVRERAKGRLAAYGGEPSDGHTDGKTSEAVAYTSALKRVKKDNVTSENIHYIMLSQIPLVSTQVATAILEVYPTIAALTVAVVENPACLDGLKVNGRKISKAVVAKIVELLK